MAVGCEAAGTREHAADAGTQFGASHRKRILTRQTRVGELGGRRWWRRTPAGCACGGKEQQRDGREQEVKTLGLGIHRALTFCEACARCCSDKLRVAPVARRNPWVERIAMAWLPFCAMRARRTGRLSTELIAPTNLTESPAAKEKWLSRKYDEGPRCTSTVPEEVWTFT